MADLVLDIVIDDEVSIVVAERPLIDASPVVGSLAIVEFPGVPGPQGASGAQGPPGQTGATGPQGEPGPAYSSPAWWFDDGPPSVIVGAKPGDLYMDVSSGTIYRLGD